ncbi:MAG TPA: CPBP family intramembrane glutamic endopeptidase [Longimicrobiales bacterium]|nr:CPBP family intramembrane glutamic endopeptidase [Longimicrobiales bacterium]
MAVALRSWVRPTAIPYIRSVAIGLVIALAGAGTWAMLARLNATNRPDIPWAAGVMALYLMITVAWLNGGGPPSESAPKRRELLRLWPPQRVETRADGLSTPATVLLLATLTAGWIAIGRLTPVPDLSGYSTSIYRWSLFVMSPVVAGVVEESAFRGYMQRGLERVDPRSAIWITSLIFVASHITHGLGSVIMLGPGIFVVSMLYGHLALRTGTILPGMCIHILGDLSYTYFGVLHGDRTLLFVQ